MLSGILTLLLLLFYYTCFSLYSTKNKNKQICPNKLIKKPFLALCFPSKVCNILTRKAIFKKSEDFWPKSLKVVLKIVFEQTGVLTKTYVDVFFQNGKKNATLQLPVIELLAITKKTHY